MSEQHKTFYFLAWFAFFCRVADQVYTFWLGRAPNNGQIDTTVFGCFMLGLAIYARLDSRAPSSQEKR